MNSEELQWSKQYLDLYKTYYKNSIRIFRWNKVFLGLAIFNVISLVHSVIKHLIKNDLDFFFYFNAVMVFAWIYLTYITFKKLKNNKLEVQSNLSRYESQLKIVDYPKYIKEQRTKKLNKLKKAN